MFDIHRSKISSGELLFFLVLFSLIAFVLSAATCVTIRTEVEQGKYHLICQDKEKEVFNNQNVAEILELNREVGLIRTSVQTKFRLAGSIKATTITGTCTVNEIQKVK